MRYLGPLSFVLTAFGATAAVAAPDCSYSVTSGIDYPASLTFDTSLIVEPGESASCDLAAGTSDTHDADTFVVYSADYRGSVEEGDTATVSVAHDGAVDGAGISGPQPTLDGGPFYRDYISSDTAGVINSTVDWSLPGTASFPASIETIDYAEVARTTRGIVQASIDELSGDRTGIIVHLGTSSDLLVGGNQPLDIPDSVAIIGALGSHTFGVTGHLALEGGLTLDGGAAVFDQGYSDTEISGVLFNARLSYLDPNAAEWRPYGAIGLRGAPGMDMQFIRQYDDNTDDGATGVSNVSGDYFGVYAQGGMLWAPTPDNNVLFSATLAQDWIGTDGWSEAMSEDNLFAASAGAGSQSFTTFKLGADWTTALSDRFDLTLTGAVGHVFAGDMPTEVAFVGPIDGAGVDETFVEYGARIGWQLTDTLKADAFVLGSTGGNSGTHAQVGAGLHAQF